MSRIAQFKMPIPMKITGRSSSITNAFINSIIPVVLPSSDEIGNALKILGMTLETIECAYCGGGYSEWDHLRPLIKDKKPTGFISEIHNLVPSCGKCNQSKGNQDWKNWIFSNAKLSPTTRGITDIAERASKLDAYENPKTPTKMDFAAIVGKETWQRYQDNLDRVQAMIRDSQELAAKINAEVRKAYEAI